MVKWRFKLSKYNLNYCLFGLNGSRCEKEMTFFQVPNNHKSDKGEYNKRKTQLIKETVWECIELHLHPPFQHDMLLYEQFGNNDSEEKIEYWKSIC